MASQWSFEPLDEDVFPAVRLARAAGAAGGCAPAVYNAANEQAVAAFHDGRLGFLGIVEVIERTLEAFAPPSGPVTLDLLRAAEAWARTYADQRIHG
jgi:1-deoxy-D-xylulose-5-phosphate reductoisomerase